MCYHEGGDDMKRWRNWLWGCLLVSVLIAAGDFFGVWERSYTSKQLGLNEYYSSRDQNANGVDDVHDFVSGARAYVQTHPQYGSRYYVGGYPDDGYGVCTDVIWHAFAYAGYSLKDMVDLDIAQQPARYGIAQPDPNIDFRRVDTLRIYFDKHAQMLTTLPLDPQDWQPGDIVIYPQHIGICSDLRNAQGYPLLIHLDPLGARERDELWNNTILAHYRWI